MRLILDLCAGSGAWSAPYVEAGYDVRRITLPAQDVRHFVPPKTVHGILAAPPCNHFARCGARWWKAKGDTALLEGLSVVTACLRIIAITGPAWWALENPVGRLRDYLGKPAYVFQPWWFGDPWTKRTWLWGRFTHPKTLALVPDPTTSVPGQGALLTQNGIRPDWVHHLPPSHDRAALRAITPPSFARAFFEANP